MNAKVNIIGSYRAQLGETPVWCTQSQSLLWVDILAQRLLRYWPAQKGRLDIHPMPLFTSAVLLTTQKERFLTVSQSGIALYDYDTQRFTPLCDYPSDAFGTRPNEAAIAPDGALWFSTMDPAAEKAIGGWYRFAVGNSAPQHLLGNQRVPNTLQWHNGHIWFADSLLNRFYCAQLVQSQLVTRAVHCVDGIPDGSALTGDGQLINARWGQSRLVRYQLRETQAQELDSLALPVAQPSSCTFGGPDLSELYITSARDGLSHPTETDGALLRISTPLTGVPAGHFQL